MSNTAKWVITVICGVLGIVALIYAVIYIAVPIHSLPGFVPGKTATTGHYHKRAFVSAIIGIVLLGIAVYVGMATRRSAGSQVGSGGGAAVGPTAEGAASSGAGE